ncbi:hypothetical protein [Marisediminicola sp. LYQ134]|uniref:hypothetical protein n=1 Tax=Marisediminicola sp. LYQ134 TaxID=3391061 RepID=UPI00398330CD
MTTGAPENTPQPQPNTPQPPQPHRERMSLVRWAVVILFGLLFAYDLFEALANLTGVLAVVDAENAVRASVDLDLISPPWALLVVTIVLPVAGFAIAALVGRRHSATTAALVFAAGLAVVAALTASLTALA